MKKIKYNNLQGFFTLYLEGYDAYTLGYLASNNKSNNISINISHKCQFFYNLSLIMILH